MRGDEFLESKNIETIPFSRNLDKSIPVFVGKSIKKSSNYKKQVEEVTAFVKDGGYAVMLDVLGKTAIGKKTFVGSNPGTGSF